MLFKFNNGVSLIKLRQSETESSCYCPLQKSEVVQSAGHDSSWTGEW